MYLFNEYFQSTRVLVRVLITLESTCKYDYFEYKYFWTHLWSVSSALTACRGWYTSIGKDLLFLACTVYVYISWHGIILCYCCYINNQHYSITLLTHQSRVLEITLHFALLNQFQWVVKYNVFKLTDTVYMHYYSINS